MPVFTFLVFIGVIFLWFLLAFLFKPVGRFFYRLFKDVKDEMTTEDKKEIDTKE